MCAQRRLRSESSLCAQWVAESPRFLHADSEDPDLTGRMPRLIWVFAGRTCVILLVLSWCGSFKFFTDLSIPRPTQSICKDGWVRYKNSCYLFSVLDKVKIEKARVRLILSILMTTEVTCVFMSQNDQTMNFFSFFFYGPSRLFRSFWAE